MYSVVVNDIKAFYGNPPLYMDYFDNPQEAEKAAIDFCVKNDLPLWAVTIECAKMLCT